MKLENVLVSISNGTTAKQNEESLGYKVTRIETIADGTINLDKTKYVELNDENFNKFCLNDGDILFSHINSTSHLGKSAIYNKNMGILVHGMNLLRFIPKKEIIFPKFLSYLLKSKKNRVYFQTRCKKAVNQSSLDQKTIKKLKINVPSLQTQKKIVEILEKTEKLKEYRQKSDELTDSYLKSVFLEMFGNLNETKWDIYNFGDLIQTLTDYHSNGSYKILKENVTLYDKVNYALMVRTTDLEKNNFVTNVKYIDEHAYEFLEKSKIFGGELIINKIGSAGNVYLMPKLDRPVSLAMNQFLIRLNDKTNNIFMFHLLKSKYGESIIKSKVKGAVTKTITKDAVRDLKIPLSPIELQNEFAEIIEKLEKIKGYQSQSKIEIDNLFNNLMQKAFKGELT